MTKEQVLSGEKFSVFGINGDFEYMPNSLPAVMIYTENSKQRPVFVLMDVVSFSVGIQVFGIDQVVEIAFSCCEQK